MRKLLILIVFLFSINFVLGADVAYILETNTPLNSKLTNILSEIGVSYDVVRDDKIATTDFSQYPLLLITEDVDRRDYLPFNEKSAIFFDERIAETVWAGADAAKTSAAKQIDVKLPNDDTFDGINIPPDGEIDVYSGSGSEMHFLRIKPRNIIVTTLAIRTNGDLPVIARSIRDINGNVVKDILLGISKPDDWNSNSELIFKNSVRWMLNDVDQDGDGWFFGEDCDDNDPTVNPGALEELDDKDQNCVNDIPILKQDIPDQSWNEDTSLSLDLSLYLADPDGDDLIYDHTTLSNIDIRVDNDLAIFIPSANWYGAESIKFTANDEEFSVESNLFDLEVIDTFDPDLFSPVVELLEPSDGFISNNDDVTLKFRATDPTDSFFECKFYSDIGGNFEPDDNVLVVASGSIHTGVARDLDDGTYNWNVECDDSENVVRAPKNKTFTVDENDPPILRSINDIEVNEGELVEIVAVADDADNDQLTYNINDNRFIKVANKFRWQTGFEDAGEYSFTVIVTDGELSDEILVSVIVNNLNREPKLLGIIPLQKVQEDNTIKLNLSNYFNDPDKDALVYTVVNSLDNLEAIIEDSIVTIMPNQNWFGNTKIKFRASDGESAVESNFVDVVITSVNDAPVLENIDNMAVNEGDLVTVIANVIDVDGDILTFSFSEPLNQNGVWQTGFEDSGEYIITVIVTDPSGLNDEETFTLIVSNINREPEFNIQIGNQNTDEDTSFDIDLDFFFSDPDGDDLIYRYENGENLIVRFNGNIMAITPKQDFNGQDSLKIIASDGSDEIKSNEFIIFVNPINDAPVFGEIRDVEVNEGEIAEIIVSGSDVDGDQITFTINDSRFVKDSNKFRWQTGFHDVGEYLFTMTITDGKLSNQKEVNVKINSFNILPKFEVFEGKSVTEDAGEQEAGIIKASDIDGGIASFEVVSGTMVDCEVNNFNSEQGSIKLFATPHNDFFGVGRCSVKVIDNDGGSSEANFNVTVENVQDSPEITQIFPDKETIEVNFNSEQIFFINSIDLDRDDLNVEWRLDNVTVSEGSNYLFNAGNEQGTYKLIVIITDGVDSDENEWIIIVGNFEPEEDKTCEELDGYICSINQTCGGIFLDASNSNLCCSVVCSDVEIPPEDDNPELTNLDKCGVGVVGDLEIEINEPDNGDDFSPLDKINIVVNVENKGDRDVDVVVEATLFDVDDNNKIEKEKIDDFEINNDEDEDVEMVIEIPNGELDEEHDYTLFIKAYEQGGENQHCTEEEIEIEVGREDHDVRIESFSMSPETLTCGGIVNTRTNVVNVGDTKEENMVVAVSVSEFGITEESGPFTLEDHDEEEGEITKNIEVTIPDGAKPGKYQVTSTTFFDDTNKEISETRTLTIGECSENGEEIVPELPDIMIDMNFEKEAGETLKVPILLENNKDDFVEYIITITDDGILETNSMNVLVPGHSAREVDINAKLKKNIVPGEHSATVTVYEEGQIAKSERIDIEIPAPEKKFKWPISLWVINILLFVIVVYFIKVLTLGVSRH